MRKIASRFNWNDFVPKSVICFKEGYTRAALLREISSGITIGIVALPLAMAFAIGSGLPPERGIFTAIIAGFLISALSGSRVQIGGPTGAFVVIVFDVVQRQGYEGLVIATLMAGFLLILMGLFRLGSLLKFIPYPVITGLTTGIALLIFSLQIKDFLGLSVPETTSDFFYKWKAYFSHIDTISLIASSLAVAAVLIILLFRRYYPKIPGAIIAVVIITMIAWLFHLPVETIYTKFGGIPNALPSPGFPSISLERIRELFPDAFTIALLAGIESLLSAVVADGMTGRQHKSNCELVAQGIANMSSVICGGIPATGAIARTATNIRLGGRTPLSGMIHAITLLLILIFLGPLAALIPLCVLAAILVVVAWNMAELDHFIEILKTSKGDAALLLTTFGLTVLVDITVAVEVGVLLAAVLFMKRMSDVTNVQICKKIGAEETDEMKDRDAIYRKDVPEHVEVFEIEGPLFFGAADLLTQALKMLQGTEKIFILRMRKVLSIDASGLRALENFNDKCQKHGVILFLSGIKDPIAKQIRKSNLYTMLGPERIFPNIDGALNGAKLLIEKLNLESKKLQNDVT